MASFTPRYGFNDEDVSQMARCTDQAEFLYRLKRILNTKSTDLSAVFDAAFSIFAFAGRQKRGRPIIFKMQVVLDERGPFGQRCWGFQCHLFWDLPFLFKICTRILPTRYKTTDPPLSRNLEGFESSSCQECPFWLLVKRTACI